MSDWGIHGALRRLVVTHPVDKEALRRWILEEYKFWKGIFHFLKDENTNQLPQLSYYYSALLNYANSSNQEQIENSSGIGKSILDLYEKEFVHHDGPLAKEFLESISDIESLKSALFSYRSAAFFSDAAYEKIYKNRYQHLIEEAEVKHAEIVAQIHSKGEEVRHRMNEYKASIEQQMEDSISNANTNLDSILDEKEEHLRDAALRVLNNIISNQPVQFWESKKLLHKKRAIVFGALSATLAALMIIIIGSVMLASHRDTLELKYFSIPIPDHFSLAIILLSASLGVWTLKILIKLTLNNINLESEALERSTMIKTYVSLSEASISEEVTTLFHKSLLATSNSKLEDDTSPDVLKAIELIFKRK